MFFLISGAPATGKSSVVKSLKDKLGNFDCHESDEIMVETGTQRRVSNEEWISKALEAQTKGMTSCFLLKVHLEKYWLVLQLSS